MKKLRALLLGFALITACTTQATPGGNPLEDDIELFLMMILSALSGQT